MRPEFGPAGRKNHTVPRDSKWITVKKPLFEICP
ncbi:Hypothetical protein LRC_16910 [Ligilactobacillus ruminis ATCC 27782]|uniref:Uncharacterized protein n=1 Tax=Ligilactobacillus ruminis (strain ATCC 27782 / RF3) TaxID=1069534 RepID=G2SRY5_LIGR2|nr:Hypothetical protein LRC_16910 [Ligilactobacillus ruminis ATCC 27782]